MFCFLFARLDKKEDDGKLSVELVPGKDFDPTPPLVTYRLEVVTGDRRGAGTSSTVFVQLYGENGEFVFFFFKKEMLFYSCLYVFFVITQKVLLDKKHWMVVKMISIAKQWLTLALNVLIWA